MIFSRLANIFFKINLARILCLFVVLVSFLQSGYASKPANNNEYIRFFLIFETLKSLELKNAVLYYSASSEFAKRDSILVSFSNDTTFSDSIIIPTRWKYQVYLKLKLSFNDIKRISNTFQYSQNKSMWEVFVGDSAIRVLPKPLSDHGNSQSSLKGLALIIQAAFEMILALLLSRILGWPPLIILMVLVANIAAFPLYLINISGLLILESLVFLVKGTVMWLVGMRKLDFYKILLLAIIVSFLSFGIKQILFFIIQIL